MTSLSDCPSGYQSLITRKWPGTREGCDCSFRSRGAFIIDINIGGCDHNQTESKCRNVDSTDPVMLDTFYSYKICGLRGGQNFLDVRRPESKPGESPT